MNRRAFLIRASIFAVGGYALVDGLPAFGQQRRFQPTRFSVRVTGEGPDVILIPGLTSSRNVWAAAVAAVPGYRYHMLQVAGFAGEPAGGNASGRVLDPLVEEIARYIADRGIRQPTIVGHSMGGTIGMLLAMRHTQAIGRLMVVDMLPRPTNLFGGNSEWLGQVAHYAGGMMADPLGRQLLGAAIGAFSPPQSATGGSDPQVVAQAMQELGAADLTPYLGRITMPMAVVYAVPDEAGREATRTRFLTAYRGAPTARLFPVEPSGHMVMSDQPAAFAQILERFLRA